MAQTQASFADAIRVNHNADGYQYLVKQTDDKTQSALFVCPKCGDALVVTRFEPEPVMPEPQAETQIGVMTSVLETHTTRRKKRDDAALEKAAP